MNDSVASRKFDLHDRTLRFAQEIRKFVRSLPRTVSNLEDISQLVRSSGSIGANYIEASESLGKKDFLMRMKISRKEAKESVYWLNLIDIGIDPTLKAFHSKLIQESTELMKIFGAIVSKSFLKA